jgi:hypothetical protein
VRLRTPAAIGLAVLIVVAGAAPAQKFPARVIFARAGILPQ